MSAVDTLLDRLEEACGQWLELRDGENSELCKDAADAVRALEASEAKIAALTAKNDALREERDRALYVIHHADISLVGLAFPDDGLSVCTGTNMHKLTAANRLKDCGLVVVEASPAGPLVRWAPGRYRSALRQEGKP